MEIDSPHQNTITALEIFCGEKKRTLASADENGEVALWDLSWKPQPQFVKASAVTRPHGGKAVRQLKFIREEVLLTYGWL